VKHRNKLVLLAKEETVIQGIIDRLTEARRGYSMEINVERTSIRRI
jgi:hypothetical protein